LGKLTTRYPAYYRLALAYAPRWLAATFSSPFAAGLRRQARVFRRLLASLSEM